MATRSPYPAREQVLDGAGVSATYVMPRLR